MNEDLDVVRAALQRFLPAKVLVYQGDELARTIPVPAGKRKKWFAVLQVLERLEWTRLELVDKAGGILGVLDAQTDDGAAAAPPTRGGDRDAQLLKILIDAQKAALSNRERETAQAVTAFASVVEMLTQAIGMLTAVHRQTLDAQAKAYQIAAAAAGAPMDDEQPQQLESSKLLEQMAPMIMSRLLAPNPPPTVAAPAQAKAQAAPQAQAAPTQKHAPKNGAS